MSAHTEHADAVLVGLAQGGDREAFAELFRRHYPAVVRACATRGQPADAEEIAQAAFVRAFERIGLCRGEARFGAWVQVIARHLCADAARARARARASTLAASGALPCAGAGADWPEEHALRQERVEAVRTVVGRLPRRQRQVLVARDLEGRRPGEIAAALGVSLGAVDSLLLRARRATAAGYRTVAAEGGMATASSAAVAVASGGAAVGPTGLGQAVRRGAEAVGQAMAGIAGRLAAAWPGVPSGLELVAAAASVLVLVGAGTGTAEPAGEAAEAPVVVAVPSPGAAGDGRPALPGTEAVVPPSPPAAPSAPEAPRGPATPPTPRTNPSGSVLALVDVEMATGRVVVPWTPETTPLDGTAPAGVLRAVPERPGRTTWEVGQAVGRTGVHAAVDTGRSGWEAGKQTWKAGKETAREAAPK